MTKKDKISSSFHSTNIFDMKLSANKRGPESISVVEILSDVLKDIELDTMKALKDDLIDPIITGSAKSRVEEISDDKPCLKSENEEDSQEEIEKLLEEISNDTSCLERSKDELARTVSEEDSQDEIEKLLEEISED